MGLRRLGLGLATAAVVATAAPASIEYRWGGEYQRWSWKSYRGDHEASQLLSPLDLSLRVGRSTRLAAGADLAWSRAEDPAGAAKLSAPRAARGAVEQGFFGDRCRVGLGVTSTLGASGLSVEEARVAEILEEVALNWPRAAGQAGTRWLLEAAAQPVRRPALLVQAGAGREWRGEYELVADGRRIEPGALLRLAGSVVAMLGPVRQEFSIQREAPERSRVVGGFWYEAGPLTRAETRSRLSLPIGQLGGSVRLLGRARGAVEAGSPFDPAVVRSGNALRCGLDLSRRIARGIGRLELAGSGVRGFAGDLGHADWVEVGISWSHPTAVGGMRLSAAMQKGSCRGDRDLSGVSAAIAFFGASR